MKYRRRDMKCPSDMKLLRNEVKFALIRVGELHTRSVLHVRSTLHLPARANFIEKIRLLCKRIFSGRVDRNESPKSFCRKN